MIVASTGNVAAILIMTYREISVYDTMNERSRLAMLCVVVALSAVPIAAPAQQVDYGRSQITVTSRQMNVPVEARFTRFTAQIAFDVATQAPIKDRKSTRLNSSHIQKSRMPSSA